MKIFYRYNSAVELVPLRDLSVFLPVFQDQFILNKIKNTIKNMFISPFSGRESFSDWSETQKRSLLFLVEILIVQRAKGL